MATQLFFRSAVSDYVTANNDANLRGTAIGWDSRSLSTARGASATSNATATVAGPTNGVEAGSSNPFVFYSPPLNADATISGSITWNLRAAESSNSANVAINGRLEVIDGATGVITLIDQTARVTECATSEGINNFAETPAAGIACKRGDRLRVRVFADDSTTMGSGFTFTFWYNGPTAAASGDSYLTLTETLTFVSEPAGTQVFPTDTASAVSTVAAALLSSFTTTDENPLSEGGNWARSSTGWLPAQLISNQAAGAGGVAYSHWTPADFGPSVEAYLTIGTLSTSYIAVTARVQDAGVADTWDGYHVRCNSAGTVQIFRVDNGVFSSALATSATVTIASGAKLGIACRGSTIAAWFQPSGGTWTLVASLVDTTYAAAGKVGFGIGASTGRVDDFYAGTTDLGFGATAGIAREAWTSRGGGVQTDVTNQVAGWTAPIQVTDTAGGTVVDWFTRPLTAFTLGGAVRCNIRGISSSASSATFRCEIALVAGDGTGATTWGATTCGASSLPASEAALSFLVAGDDLAVTDGQRLRIRLLIDDPGLVAMSGSQTATLYYAGAAAATGDTYLTFTQTLTEFVSAVTYVPRSGFVNHQNPGVL